MVREQSQEEKSPSFLMSYNNNRRESSEKLENFYKLHLIIKLQVSSFYTKMRALLRSNSIKIYYRKTKNQNKSMPGKHA
jgi:hypothetical protein